MRQNDIHVSTRRPFTSVWILFALAGFLPAALRFVPAASAQGNDNTAKISELAVRNELALRNMSRVAASPAEIKSLLIGNAGLMVELKRWVAKDATEHGQFVSDSDLTSDAIFDRLELDVEFRSVATVLIQRYGYLLPVLNPTSEIAKARDSAVLERSQRQRAISNSLRMDSCDSQVDTSCNVSSTGSQPAGDSNQEKPQGEPVQQNPSGMPALGGNPTTRTQLMRTGDNLAGSSQFPTPDFSASSPSFDNVSMNSVDPSQEGNGGLARISSTGSSTATSTAAGVSDGLLAAYGNEMGRTAPNDMLPSPVSASADPKQQPSEKRLRPQPPEMIRKRSPYENIPSLYDMYIQTVTRPTAPRRFGAEVFENGGAGSQSIPMDLPAGPDYVVGTGDALSIDLWGGVSQRLYRTVDREGRVSLPEIGPVLVSGKSLAAVQQNVQQILRTQFRDVSADVSLARLRTIRVYEVGDVMSPGAYDISSLSTPLNALFSAGGPTQRGSMRILKHYRGTRLVETVDVYDLLLHGVKVDLQRLENGDTVQVPPIGPQVTIEGMVRRPAIYELRDEKTLADVLELAGGLLPAAALRHIEVQRIVTHEKQTMLSVDIPEDKNITEATKQLEAFEIHDGDRIRIFPIAPYNQDTIYLEGHVVRPGRYTFRENMRVTDVISSYKDLLPEPAGKYAEIIRLNAPDFHPSLEGFDLADVLANPSHAPVLHAMDTVRIFSRYDFENPPTVSVLGDVRLPGTYQTSGQIHLADAVHLAGGLTPDAQTVDAQIFRYLPDGKFKIFSVSLSLALRGDPIENILLQPRDRLLIHKNPDAIEPASVYKHVPMMESNAQEAIRNNVLSFPALMDLAEEAGCASFVLISSDKAVNPINIMGATKRICELIVASRPANGMRAVSVRFGNVLGSNGSIIPVLQRQLEKNQALTITHPEITRFFMTTREAVALVLQAFVIGSHGDILILDMGEPMRILDLARTLIRLTGRSEDDVEIRFIGVRKGEKLKEELFYEYEGLMPTSCCKIMRTNGSFRQWKDLCRQLDELRASLSDDRARPIRAIIKEIIPEYSYELVSGSADDSSERKLLALEKTAAK